MKTEGDLAAALGEDALVTDAHDLARYEKGWRYGEGRARVVARPRTHEEVAQCVRLWLRRLLGEYYL